MSYPGLHPSLVNFVSEMEFISKSTADNRDPFEFRRMMAEKASKLTLKRPRNIQVEDKCFETEFGAVNARIYNPDSRLDDGSVLMYMHGGGWIIGDLNSHDAVCVDIALDCNITVIALEYSLAPENPYPVALNQCDWVFKNIYENSDLYGIDPSKIIVGGDSAGGNLAFALCLKLRAEKFEMPLAQLLIYPCVDLNFNTSSYLEHSHAPFLDKDSMIWIWNTYLENNLDIDDPLAIPAYEKDYSNLPPALIVAAELDPLNSEGKMLMKRLVDANVPSIYFEAKGMIHGFIRCRDESNQANLEFNKLTRALSLIASLN